MKSAQKLPYLLIMCATVPFVDNKICDKDKPYKERN